MPRYPGARTPGPAAATSVFIDQGLIRERRLGIVVAPAVPRVARHGVQVPPVFLGILAVITLPARQPENAFLENRVASIPQRQSQAQSLFDVAKAGQAVLAPSIRARAGVIVREIVPRLPVSAVILTHGTPLAFADIRSPQIPVTSLAQAVLEPAEAVDALPLVAHAQPGPARCAPRFIQSPS